MKIAILGAHGVGKSALAAKMFAYACETGRNARLIHEVARNCPFPLNERFTLDAATWIVTEHIKLELNAVAKGTEFVICDRSAFDPLVYLINKSPDGILDMTGHVQCDNCCRGVITEENEGTHCIASLDLALYEFALTWLDTYDTIIHVYPSTKGILGDGTRSTDKKFRNRIHEIFLEEMSNFGLSPFYYTDEVNLSAKDKRYMYMNAEDVFEKENNKFFEQLMEKN